MNKKISAAKKRKKKQLRKKRIREKRDLKKLKKNKKCSWCGNKKNLTFHHAIPKKDGGKYKKSNLIILCRKCHNKKHENKKNIL